MTCNEFMLVYRYLASMIPDLPEDAQLMIRGVHDDIKSHIDDWRGGGPEPQWDRFAHAINFVLEEDCGMDPLFTFLD